MRCKLCPIAHRLGAFVEPLKDLAASMRDSHEKTAQFLACLKELVRLINEGEVTLNMKLRAGTKNKIQQVFSDARKQVVKIIRESSVKVKLPYRARLLSKWEEANPGKDAEQEGHQVRWIPTPDQGLVKCVMLRTLGEGDWDVDVAHDLIAQHEEHVDDGTATIREGQQADAFERIVQESISGFNAAGARMLPEARPAASPAPGAVPEGHDDEGVGGAEREADSDGQGEESDGDDEIPSIMGSIFQKVMPAAAPQSSALKTKAAHAKPPTTGKAVAKPALKASPAKAAKGKQGKPLPSPERSTTAASSSSSAVAFVLPIDDDEVDVEEFLSKHGYNELKDELEGIKEQLKVPILQKVILDYMLSEKKELLTQCKGLVQDCHGLYRKIIAFKQKLRKRKRVPDSVLENLTAKHTALKARGGSVVIVQGHGTAGGLQPHCVDLDIDVSLSLAVTSACRVPHAPYLPTASRFLPLAPRSVVPSSTFHKARRTHACPVKVSMQPCTLRSSLAPVASCRPSRASPTS